MGIIDEALGTQQTNKMSIIDEALGTMPPLTNMQAYGQAVNPTVSTTQPRPTTKAITERNLPVISPPDSLSAITRPFKAQAYETMKGYHQGLAGFSQRLDDIATYISDKTGLEKGGLFGEAAKYYAQNADYWDKRAKEVGTKVVDEIIGSALGGAIPGISEFMLNVPYSALSGAAEAHKQGKSELTGAISEGAKRFALGKIFEMAGQLKQPLSSLAMGSTMALQTAGEGGSASDIGKSFGVGALYGVTSPGGNIGIREIMGKPEINMADRLPSSDWPVPSKTGGKMVDVPPAPVREVPLPPKPSFTDVLDKMQEKKTFEHDKITSSEKINAITLEEAGKLIAKGDPEVLHHIQEGVATKGQAALQDAIKSEEGKVILQAHKGEERKAVIDRIQQIEPEIDKALKGEPKWASFGSEARKQYYNEDTILESKRAQVYDFNDKKWYTVKDKNDYLKKRDDIHWFISGPAGEERTWYRYGNMPESNRSTNFTEQKGEMGVSVYATPKGSSPFFADREVYSGKGRQVGWGSDGEPLIIPTSKWGRTKPMAKPMKTGKEFNPETDSLADMIRKEGGISNIGEALKGDLKRFNIKEGYNLLNNKSGKSLDSWVERAKEEHFESINENTTVSDLWDLIRKDVDAKKQNTSGRVWSLKRQEFADMGRTEQARVLREGRSKVEIPASLLDEGETFKISGEKFKVTDIAKNGTVTLKDGETIKVKPDEILKYDRGTLKKGEIKSEEADFVPTDIKGEEQGIWRGKGFNAEMPTGKIKTEALDESKLPLFAGEQKPETETQQGLFAGTSTAADLGGYAPSRGKSESTYTPPSGLFKMEMPELVELVKGISEGKYPSIKAKLSHRLAVGLFRPSRGTIELKADIFKNPEEAAKILSHEIGHLVDWIPDKDMSRGNILGRIASLKKYMSKLLEEYPDSPNEVLTPQDRVRIRKEAERLAKGTAKTTIEVEEQIIKELPLKSDDIIKIMNDVGGVIRQTDKKLYEWFAGLSGDDKKSILKEALKGRIPDWVSFKKTVIEGVRTVKKTIFETVDPREKYHDMIIAEIKKRRLYQYETIMNELKTLSKEWKPFDETKVHSKFTQYRYSSKELYADSISVLFNDPALLKERAPNYYKAFFAYMEKKPEVSAIYEDIQNRLKSGYEDIFKQRDSNIESMFKRGETAYAESLKKPPTQVWKSIKKSIVDINTEAIHKIKEVEKQGIRIPSEKNPRYWIEELPYMSGPIKQYYNDIEHLVRNTASDVDIGKYMFAMRARTERAILANPLGVQQKNAIDYINYLKGKDPEGYAKIEEAVRSFRKLRATQIVPEIESAEMFDDTMVKLMRDNEHYATFDIIKYIDKRYGKNISGHIYKQIGTLNETANPFTATIMKDTALLRMAHITKTKKTTVSFLQQYFPEEVVSADTRWNGKYHAVVEPKDPNKGLIVYLNKGKVEGYYVDKEIANTFHKDPFKGGIILKTWLAISQPLKDLFVSKNPGFVIWNLQRDIRATSKQIQGYSLPKALYYEMKAIPDAYKDVIKDMHTPDVGEMYKGKMLIAGRAYGKDVNPDSMLERMMQEFLIKPQEYNNKVIQPFKAFWDFMDKPGQFSERLTKIAGYKYLKANSNLSEKEIAHLVRTRVGSPDFMRGGEQRLLYNNIFLYSNAGKEGWRSSIEAYKENPSRYIWKTIEYDVLPKLVMYGAALGLLGDKIKKWFDKVPERDKANYQIVPIGETSDGKAIYFRIPHDYTGQVIAGLTWKILNQNKDINMQDMLDYSAGGFPYTGLHPYIGVTMDTFQYMTGKNPYDSFTGRYVVPEQVFEAGGIKSLEEFGKHTANQLGAGIIYRFKGANLRETTSELEKVLGYPIVGNILERFVKVSDYGTTEEIKRTIEPIRQARAQENIAVADKIIEDMKGRKEISEQNVQALYKQLKNNGIITRKEYPDFRDTYKLMAGRKLGDPYMRAFISAKSNEEKSAILNMIMKEKEANR